MNLAIVVMIVCKSAINLNLLGLVKAFGVLMPAMEAHYQCSYTVLGFICSLHLTLNFISCPFIQKLSSTIGLRTVAILGGLLNGILIPCTFLLPPPAIFGLLLSVAGIGSAMLYQTSSVALQEYSGDQFGAINTVCSLISTVISVFIPPLTNTILQAYGLQGTLLIVGGLCANMIPVGLAIRRPSSTLTGSPPVDTISSNTEQSESLIQVRPASDLQNIQETESDSENDDKKSLFLDGCGAYANECDIAEKESSSSGELAKPGNKCRLVHIFQVVGNMFAIGTLKTEPAFTICFVPCMILNEYIYIGWNLYAVSFGLNVGLSEEQAPYLVLTGLIGSSCACIFLIAQLRIKPRSCLKLFPAFSLLVAMTMSLLQLNASFPFLLSCAFAIGFGAYGVYSLCFAIISIVAGSTERFAGLVAVSYLIQGIGISSSGTLIGLFYDVTHSFKAVFGILSALAGVMVILSSIFNYLHYRKKGISTTD